MGQSVITFAGFVVLLLLDLTTSSSNRRCFPLYEERTLCFIQPDPPVAQSWSDAQRWCSNIGATLSIPHTHNHHTVYGNALGYFGLNNRTMWLGANSTFDLNDWYWTNGTRFTGKIDHGNNTLKTHAYIVRNGTDIKFVAADPRIAEAGFICQHAVYQNNERSCAHASNSFWSNGRCYRKDRYQHHDFNDFVSQCGGMQHLASINLDDLNEMSRWIDDQKKFWIGLRCTTWTWQDAVSGKTFELTETRFRDDFPNNTSPECLASYESRHYGMQWMNQKCSTKLQFICQQYADSTTTTKTTKSTSTTTRRPSSSATTRISATPMMNSAPSKVSSAAPRSNDATHVDVATRQSATTPFSSLSMTSSFRTLFRSSEVAGTSSLTAQLERITSDPSDSYIYNKYGLVVLLGFGLCGGLLLVGIIWLAVLTARYCKVNRYSPKTTQKQPFEDMQLTYSNPYEIPSCYTTSALDGVEKPYEELQ